MDIKDFKVGQIVWVELTGNAKRNKTQEECIEEWEITSVGKKYLEAKRKGTNYVVKFEKRGGTYSGRFVQKTTYCIDYIIYESKQALLDTFEKRRLLDEVSEFFRGYGASRNILLEQLRKISAIIKESGEEQ